MLNPNASSRPPATTYVPVGPNVVYEVEQEERPSATVTKRTKLTTTSRDEAEDFGAPHDEQEHAMVKRAEQELEDVTADGLELGGFYAVIGGIAAASGHMDARRYYRYVGNGADMRTITSPVVKGARTRREFLANNRHLPKEWLNNVLAIELRKELVPAAAPSFSSAPGPVGVGSLDAVKALEVKFESLIEQLESTLTKTARKNTNDIRETMENETDQRNREYSAFTTEMKAALKRQEEQQTRLLDQMAQIVAKLGRKRTKNAPAKPTATASNDAEETELGASQIHAQLIGCDATAADKNILQRMLPNSQEEIAYFAAVMTDETANLTPAWVWATMTKPVFKFLLGATTWGGLEMVASELGRLPLFHGVPKDTVLLDLIASEDVRDVFCKFVSHTFEESNRETGRTSTGSAGKKSVAIFNSTSFKAMAAHSNWKMGAKLWFEHNVYYAPNPVTRADTEREIQEIQGELDTQTDPKFVEREGAQNELLCDAKVLFEKLPAILGFNTNPLITALQKQTIQILWNEIETYISTHNEIDNFQPANRDTATVFNNLKLLGPSYSVFAKQIQNWFLPLRFAAFIDSFITNPPDRALYMRAFKLKQLFTLSTQQQSRMSVASDAVQKEYKQLVQILARRHLREMKVPYLKKLLFVKQREQTCYRACVLKAM